MTVEADTAVLDPDITIITFQNGMKVKIEDLRLRQFIRLVKIITRGVLPIVDLVKLRDAANAGGEAFAAQFLALVLAGVAESEEETVHFLQSMVTPATLIDKPVLQKSDVQFNERQWALLDKEMKNPDPLDTLDIFEAIVRKESDNMQAFLEKIKGLWAMAEKMGVVNQKESQTVESLSQTFQEVNLPDPSVNPSTPSNQSTDMTTSTGSTSLSEEYVNSLP